jgi:hypothetical protein
MKSYLDSSRFNVAPGAARHTPLAWVVLAGSVVLLGASLYPLSHQLGLLNTAKSTQTALAKSLQREAAEQRKRLGELNNAEAQEREKIRARIQEFTHMSWDGIFDALEMAADSVHAGVSIISLAPAKVNGSATQLNITALAANLPIMLAYVDALQKDPRVLQVEISTQQPDEKAGPSVIRFRVSVVLNPKVILPHPAQRAASDVAQTDAGAIAPQPGPLAPSLKTSGGR